MYMTKVMSIHVIPIIIDLNCQENQLIHQKYQENKYTCICMYYVCMYVYVCVFVYQLSACVCVQDKGRYNETLYISRKISFSIFAYVLFIRIGL